MHALIPEQLAQQFQRCPLVSALLTQTVENFALVIDRPPQIHPPATDPHHHFVEMPPARRRRSAAAQICCDQRPELFGPASHRFTTGLNTTLRQQFLDIADAERETKIKPHCLQNNIRRKAMTFKGNERQN
jgi:hypothetical protein